MEDFKALCKQHVEADKVKVVVIDYLQLLSERKTRQNRDAELSFITRELKNLAKDLQICIVASSQLSRSLETRGGDRKPLLSDLRESGAIEQNADKVLFIYRPEYYGFMQDEYGNSTQGLVELIVAKNRTGHLGSIYFKRNATLSAYEPYDEPQHQFNFSPNRLDELKEKTDPSPPF
jgi:replicative DNA helicase